MSSNAHDHVDQDPGQAAGGGHGNGPVVVSGVVTPAQNNPPVGGQFDTPGTTQRQAHRGEGVSTPALANTVGHAADAMTSTPYHVSSDGSLGFNSSDDSFLAEHSNFDGTCFNPLTRDSVLNNGSDGSGVDELLAQARVTFDRHEAERAARAPRRGFNKRGKGRGRGFGVSYANPSFSPYMGSFFKHNLKKLQSLEAMVADLTRYSRRTTFLLCHPYRPPVFGYDTSPIWRQQSKMLAAVALSLGVGYGANMLESCHALGKFGWVLKCSNTMYRSLYTALLNKVGKPVAGYVVNHHLAPADRQMHDRLLRHVGGGLVEALQVNPRTLIVEVRLVGNGHWQPLPSWAEMPESLQKLIGELPSLISQPWILPETLDHEQEEAAPAPEEVVAVPVGVGEPEVDLGQDAAVILDDPLAEPANAVANEAGQDNIPEEAATTEDA